MKTQAWTPPANTGSDRPEGLFVDDLVQLVQLDTKVTGEIPAPTAFVMAVELISKKRPFEIRDSATFNIWLSFDGEVMRGSGSMQQVVRDTAAILDAIIQKNLREFQIAVSDAARQHAAARDAAIAAEKQAPEPETSSETAESASSVLEGQSSAEVGDNKGAVEQLGTGLGKAESSDTTSAQNTATE